MTTDVGPVGISVPCDTDGTFEPQIVRKRQRRAVWTRRSCRCRPRALTRAQISAHLTEVYGASVSKSTTTITDSVMEGMHESRNRPLDPVYPVLFVDAIQVKIRDGQVANRPIHLVMAVTVEGHRGILGIWAGAGAKFRPRFLTGLKNRGLD